MSGLFLDARRELLNGSVDYSGSIQPTPAGLDDAVAEYRAARSSRHGWIVGRFVVAASRLESLAGVLTRTMVPGEPPWPVAVIMDGDLAAAASGAQTFHAHMGSAAEVVMTGAALPAELGVDPGPGAVELIRPIAVAATSISGTVAAFLEIPHPAASMTGITSIVNAIATVGNSHGRVLGASLRLDGQTGQVPSPDLVARFLVACRASDVPFRTAGLNRAFRLPDDLGWQSHGFINVLAATALCETGTDEHRVALALSDSHPSSFTLGTSGLTWRDHRIGVPAIQALRRTRLPSFDSPSLTVPIADLTRHQMLETP